MDGLFYAYGHVPRSSHQQQWTQARLAALIEERKKRKDPGDAQHIERTISRGSAGSTGTTPERSQNCRHDGSDGGMEATTATRTNTSSSSLGSAHSDQAPPNLLSQPFELRHGRRYIREVPYPLPCDLAELQRQDLRTLLGCQVFGRAVCSPKVRKDVPRKVLDVGCGSGYWSAMCNDYFQSLGVNDVAFTGLDIAPLASDLSKQGVNWTFVRHDIRRMPLPFEDGEFDLIMLKDLSLTLPMGAPFEDLLDEVIRCLRVGGTLEIRESDHVLRSLVSAPPPPSSKQAMDQDVAELTATFSIAPGTPFAAASNKYLTHANNWISEALDRRKMPPAPCARIAQVLFQEPDTLGDVGFRRVAIPLSELRWERESYSHARRNSEATDSLLSEKGKGKASDRALTEDQAALRHTALLTVLQMIESLEPLLKEVSGKNSEEWSHWWASMMSTLLDPDSGALNGECFEMGAWWATKRSDD